MAANPVSSIKDLGPKALIGWAALFVTLSMASDVPSLATLAVSFSYLILISTLLTNGPDAFDWLSSKIGNAPGSGIPLPGAISSGGSW